MTDAPLHPDNFDDDEFIALALAYLENRASPEQCARLGDHLAASPEARRAFNRLAAQLVTLQTRTAVTASPKPDGAAPRTVGISESSPPVSAAGVPIYRKGHEPQAARIRPHHYAIAAVLLVACGVAIYLIAFNAAPANDPAPNPPSPSVATLIENTGKLTVPNGYAAEGTEYAAGDYILNGGRAQFVLTNRVSVELRGDTRLRMHNSRNVTLVAGRAEFKVPKQVTGFTVHLPDRSRIVDLGTAFRVSIDEAGLPLLRVTEGRVAWTAAGSDPEMDAVVISAGQSARLVGGRPVLNEPILIAHWKLDESAGGLATDASVNGYHATLGATPTAESDDPQIDRPGRFGSAYGFDPDEQDYIDASAHVHEFSTHKRGTIAFWINTTTAKRQGVFRCGASGDRASDRLAIEITEFGTMRLVLRSGEENLLDLTTQATINDGKWHHIAVTQDDENATLFLDGKRATLQRPRINSGAWFANVNAAAELWIGRDTFPARTPPGTLAGALDDVAIFDDALPPQLIAKLVRLGAERIGDAPATVTPSDHQQE